MGSSVPGAQSRDDNVGIQHDVVWHGHTVAEPIAVPQAPPPEMTDPQAPQVQPRRTEVIVSV